MTGKRAITNGPRGDAVAANIARLRARHGMTTRQLSSELERAGRPIPPSGITRIEKGQRTVTVDDLFALAECFNAPPLALAGESACDTCHGLPPAGFTCDACGAPARPLCSDTV